MAIPSKRLATAQLLLLRIANALGQNSKVFFLFAPRLRIYSRGEFPLVSFKEVFVDRIYEPPLALPHQPRIIDIGGYLGLASLYFALRYPGAHIEVFEPNPEAYHLLVKNTSALSSAVINVHNFAVGSSEGIAELFVENGPRIPTDASVFCRDIKKVGNVIRVPTLDIRSIVMSPVDLLKLDIEGAEYDCLEALRPERANIRMLVIEFHDIVSQAARMAAILNQLRDSGYNLLDADQRRLAVPTSANENSAIIWAV